MHEKHTAAVLPGTICERSRETSRQCYLLAHWRHCVQVELFLALADVQSKRAPGRAQKLIARGSSDGAKNAKTATVAAGRCYTIIAALLARDFRRRHARLSCGQHGETLWCSTAAPPSGTSRFCASERSTIIRSQRCVTSEWPRRMARLRRRVGGRFYRANPIQLFASRANEIRFCRCRQCDRRMIIFIIWISQKRTTWCWC